MEKAIKSLLLSLMVLMVLNTMSEGISSKVAEGQNTPKKNSMPIGKLTVSALIIFNCSSILFIYSRLFIILPLCNDLATYKFESRN